MPLGVIVSFVVVFALTLLAVSMGLKFFDARRKTQMTGMLHTAAGEPVEAIDNLLKEINPENPSGFKALLASLDFTRHAQEQIQQAGLNWSSNWLLASMAMAAILGLVLGLLFPFLVDGPITAAVLGVAFSTLPYLYVRKKRQKRLNTLEEQFPEALDFLSRSMRAGHAFSISLEMVGEEMADPLGQEFRALFNEQNRGAPLDVALRNFGLRQPERDPHAPRVRHPRALPFEGPGKGGQRPRAAHRHHSDHAADRHHAGPAVGGAGLFAGHGRGFRRQVDDRRRRRSPDSGQFLHQEDHQHQGLIWNIHWCLPLSRFWR
jgi:hypothetical protein